MHREILILLRTLFPFSVLVVYKKTPSTITGVLGVVDVCVSLWDIVVSNLLCVKRKILKLKVYSTCILLASVCVVHLPLPF